MNTHSQTNKVNEAIIASIKEGNQRFSGLISETKKAIVGQQHAIERICIGLLCNGHILLEGVPGLAKTTLIKTFSNALGLSFSRIQFTPDLLPSDVVGTLVYSPKTQEFTIKKGPVFSQIVLADEINRAPAKVQSALLEAMQEHTVTLGEQTLALPKPFLVLATQNPIEQEGTYRLPQAQLDRFMFKLHITHPNAQEEKEILRKVFNPVSIMQVLSHDDITSARKLVDEIYIDDRVVDYIVELVQVTRDPARIGLDRLSSLIEHGASPRATLTLHHAARAHAFLRGRHFVIPDDVKAVCTDALRHRLILTYEAEAEGISPDAIIDEILHAVPAP